MTTNTSYNCEVDYDERFDFLSIRRPGFKTTYSLEAGAMTIDMTRKEFVGVEIQNATVLLSELLGARISKAQLAGITKAKAGFVEKNNYLAIIVGLTFGNRTYEKEIKGLKELEEFL